jgi:hypothetical protein
MLALVPKFSRPPGSTSRPAGPSGPTTPTAEPSGHTTRSGPPRARGMPRSASSRPPRLPDAGHPTRRSGVAIRGSRPTSSGPEPAGASAASSAGASRGARPAGRNLERLTAARVTPSRPATCSTGRNPVVARFTGRAASARRSGPPGGPASTPATRPPSGARRTVFAVTRSRSTAASQSTGTATVSRAGARRRQKNGRRLR